MAGTITLIVVIGLVICSIVVTAVSAKAHPTDDFDWWFGEVKRLAPSYGFIPEDINNFNRSEWYDWYALGYKPEYAIKNSLSVV